MQWCIQKTFQVGSLRHNLVQESNPFRTARLFLQAPCISGQSWGKGGGGGGVSSPTRRIPDPFLFDCLLVLLKLTSSCSPFLCLSFLFVARACSAGTGGGEGQSQQRAANENPRGNQGLVSSSRPGGPGPTLRLSSLGECATDSTSTPSNPSVSPRKEQWQTPIKSALYWKGKRAQAKVGVAGRFASRSRSRSRRVSPLFLMLTFSGLSLLSLAVRLRLPAGLEEDDGQARSLRGLQLGLSLWGQRVRSCVCYA